MPDTLILHSHRRPKNYPAIILFLSLVDAALLWANLLMWWPSPEPLTTPVPTPSESEPWEGDLFRESEEEDEVPYRPTREQPPVPPTDAPQPTPEPAPGTTDFCAYSRANTGTIARANRRAHRNTLRERRLAPTEEIR